MVVHGHTISEVIDQRANRTGIDTGAYATGVLTAMGAEGDQTWFLQTRPSEDAAER
jgi:serine/threonine protein phosphatase 1